MKNELEKFWETVASVDGQYIGEPTLFQDGRETELTLDGTFSVSQLKTILDAVIAYESEITNG